VLVGRSPRRPTLRSSRTQTRVLVALVVAASAVGPLVAVASGTTTAPLSALQFLFLSPPPDTATVRDVCLDPARADDCYALQSQLRLAGFGPAILSVVPVLLVLVAAEGLRRGRRFAWWAALLLNGALSVLGAMLVATAIATPRDRLVAFESIDEDRYVVMMLLPLAQPLLVVGLLLATHRAFDILAARFSYRRLAAVTGVALVVVCAAYLV